MRRLCIGFCKAEAGQLRRTINFQKKRSSDSPERLTRPARHGFRSKTARCALLVIDMQDEFVKPHWTPFWVPEATRQVARLKRLIEHCRAKHVPVIFTAFLRSRHTWDRPRSGPLMPGRHPGLGDDPSFFREAHIWFEIAPLEDEVLLLKPSYGAARDHAQEHAEGHGHHLRNSDQLLLQHNRATGL